MTDRLLMANRAGREGAPVEAEPVVVEQDGDVAVLLLDDGGRLEFDRRELRAVLDDAA